MKTRRATWLAIAAVAVLCVLGAAPTAGAAPPNPGIVVQNGVTQPVFGYTDAIRERVWVESSFDTDLDGVADRIALDIMRPAASESGLKVPVIMDASPYYSTLGRGNESEFKRDLDGDGLLDRWPLYYDNYFVPRGYAVVLLDMVGTNNSTGCPVTGGPPDHLSAVVGIDWLNGRAKGYDKDGNEVVADWHNGRTGMIGKSYDGTLANGAASTGVEGLSTIVPISAISSWYDYTRSNGVVTRGNSYPSSLSNTVTDPGRRAYCAAVRATMALTDGDETGDYTPFWLERDYTPDAGNVRASVFVSHGLQDDNVMPDHFSKWWDALPANVPKKLWLTRTGHVDPFDFRRAEWVSTLHRWFDHELQGVRNDVLTEPQADIEYGADEWRTYRRWPVDAARERLAEAHGGYSDDGGSARVRAAADAEPAPRPPDDHGHAIPEREHCDLEPDHGDGQPSGLPLGSARGSRSCLRDAGGADSGVRERDGHELRCDPRRLRGGNAGLPHGRRRADADDAGLLGRGEPC